MAVAYSPFTPPDLLSQQYPPPLLPKPGKDNVRLQKLLKRTAKKKASAQTSQSATPFRSNLSPVNEASPDLERSEHATPPLTPETPPSLYSYQQPPRFNVRPLYQHVPSPYPTRAAYGRAARMSPQTVAIPSYSFTQHVTTVSTYSGSAHVTGITQVAQMSASAAWMASSVPEATIPAAEMYKPQAGLRPTTTPQTKPSSPGPTPYPTAGSQALIRPLTVLTPLVKPKSPRPTFKATEPSRSPKPMFDVPQIRMYTASTSYYETSRTPPVYDTAGLTAIGSTVAQGKTSSETKQDLVVIRRGTTPTAEIHNSITTPAAEIKRATPTSEVKRATPTSEIKRATPTSEIKRATPTSEIKRATPTSEIKRATPTSEVKRATPTSEVKRATPTSEIKRATPTSEIKRATPTSNYEFQTSRTSAGRPRTPAYRTMQATTPVFEISRPNPLLFAVSPVTVEPERSRTPQTLSTASQSMRAAEPHEIMVNGDVHQSDTKPATKPVQQSIKKSRSEPDLARGTIPTAPIGSQRTPTLVPMSPGTTYQRPKTPTYEATRLLATSPGYKRPRTPTHGTSPSGISPVGFQRPKTPTQVSQKSAYRGLTPAEYAAYGGIKTYAPTFGISASTMSTQEEVKGQKSEQSITPTPEPCEKSETPKDVGKPLKDEKVVTAAPVPVIVVSQASDSPGMILPKETSTDSVQAAAKQEPDVIPETPKSKPPSSEKQKVEVEDTKMKTKTPEVKGPAPKSGDQDPLKAVRKLLGKTQVQTPEPKAATKQEVSEPKEPAKAVASTEGSKPDPAAPALPVTAESGAADKAKDKKSELASEAKPSIEKKEEDKSLPAAEPLLKAMLKPKGASKASGWSRLKKHMVVEQEEPKFPETGSQKEAAEPGLSEAKKPEAKAGDQPATEDEKQSKDAPKATKMWDAVLFQMFSSKENIMHQIELNKSEEEKEETMDEGKDIPSFAFRLPVLLFSPKFDAKKLKEAASRPVTKISTVFEMGLIGRKGKEEEPTDFNRTAKGFTAT